VSPRSIETLVVATAAELAYISRLRDNMSTHTSTTHKWRELKKHRHTQKTGVIDEQINFDVDETTSRLNVEFQQTL
jgi:hypothetical protein